MSDAQYKCPKCGSWIARRCTYYAGTYEHKCYKCRSLNIITVTGHEHWVPSSTTAKEKNTPKNNTSNPLPDKEI